MSTFLATRRQMFGVLAASCLARADDNWIDLFDGHTLNGWRPSENKGSWQVEDGALAARGPRSHLFYTGTAHGADFRNFELEVEVLTRPDCNSGVYFHTRYQETNFPEKGFEVQINNTAKGEGDYRERKKTGSLYGLRNIYKQFVPDEQWFKIHVAVRGKNVQIRLNGMLLVDYTEPTPPVIPEGGERERFVDHGTFALQCHNDGSRAFFRSVRVRPLPDSAEAPAGSASPAVDEVYRAIINIGRHNLPIVDCDVHLSGGLTLESALRKSRRDGLEYGITMSAGAKAKVKNDGDADIWLKTMQGQPVFLAMYPQGRDWTKLFSHRTVASFDFVLRDTTELADQAGPITDAEAFMNRLTSQTAEILGSEPIDIWAKPTYLPSQIASQHDALWTEARMQKVISAAQQNQVAIEINDRFRIPDVTFIRMAKAAGCKFSFGSGNSGPSDLRRCEYGLQMVAECKLAWHDFFVRDAWWPRAVERKGASLLA